MRLTNRLVIQFYAKDHTNEVGFVQWKGSSASCKDGVLRSEGEGVLAYRLSPENFLKDGDLLSHGAGWNRPRNQGLCQQFCKGPTVSFTALRAAGVSLEEIAAEDILDQQEDKRIYLHRADKDGAWFDANDTRFEPPAQGMLVSPYAAGSCQRAQWHIMGGVLLRYEERYLLCALDESRYFVAELAQPCATVAEAFEQLKPPLVSARAVCSTDPIYRQGEWFFVKSTETFDSLWGMSIYYSLEGSKHITKHEFRKLTNNKPLPKRNTGSHSHICRHIEIQGTIYATGLVRHDSGTRRSWGRGGPQHAPIKLGADWYIAERNTEKASWSVGGRFD